MPHVCMTRCQLAHLANRKSAKPCANCVEVLKNMGVKNVAWTTNKQSFELSRIDNLQNDFLTRRRNQVETGLGQFEENGS